MMCPRKLKAIRFPLIPFPVYRASGLTLASGFEADRLLFFTTNLDLGFRVYKGLGVQGLGFRVGLEFRV